MIRFDDVLPALREILTQTVAPPGLIINRDLNGRVRLIAARNLESAPDAAETLCRIAREMKERLGAHAFPADQAILYEDDLDQARQGVVSFPLDGVEGVEIIDRLAVTSDWVHIAPPAPGAPRIVFFSIKGGVGRSTALAASAWALAQSGKTVLVLDLDLESPGLSSALLPEEKRPTYGITDWLVEDLVDQADGLIEGMFAISPLAREGTIFVVPAHGRDPGEYVAKLGRVWMPKPATDTAPRQIWPERLNRLVGQLDQRLQPDIILIDSRAGIDEVAASCVTALGADLVLLFAIDGQQTWTGYKILFEHWKKYSVIEKIREKLQLVAAMVPDDDRAHDYFDGMRQTGYNLFSEFFYDEIPPGETGEGAWNFDEGSDEAPHYPLAIRWNRGFFALRSLHERFAGIDGASVEANFGSLIAMLQGMGTPAIPAEDQE